MKILLATLFMMLTSIASAESYLCIPDRSTGFAYNKSTKSWYSTQFNVQDTKYVLSNTDGKWIWKEVGEEYSSSTCGDFNDLGFIDCKNLTSLVSFNTKTLRFQNSSLIGYVASVTEFDGEQTPFIEIGRCSKL